jgi:hypothetical protein
MSDVTSDPTGYAPAGPITESPSGGFAERNVREEAITAALAGVELGAYDERVIAWLLNGDDPTLRTVVSLIWRARQAERFNASTHQ